jgi:hypothetical protein
VAQTSRHGRGFMEGFRLLEVFFHLSMMGKGKG